MGQKVNPNILRIGITKDWDNKWFANKRKYSQLLLVDLEIEKIIRLEMRRVYITMKKQIDIIRTSDIKISAYLLSQGISLIRTEKDNPQKIIFCFFNTLQVKNLLKDFGLIMQWLIPEFYSKALIASKI